MSDRKRIHGKIPGPKKLIATLYNSCSTVKEDLDISEGISMYQCIQTGTYYLYYSRSAESFWFAVPRLLEEYYLEISEQERYAPKEELIRLVMS